MWAIKLCLGYFVAISFCDAYKILVVFPMPAKSHGILGDGIVRHLLKEGHEVTYISPFLYKSASPKFRWIDVSANFKALSEESFSVEAIMQKKIDYSDQGFLSRMLIGITKITIENDNVQKLLNNSKEHFDAVIVKWLFNELQAGYAALYNCPLIWSSSLDVHWQVLRLVDEPINPAYVADPLSLNLPPFNFWQRITELFTQLEVQYLRYTQIDGFMSQEYEKLFVPIIAKRGRKPPSFEDIHFNASLILGNSHVSLGEAVAVPPNYIPIAGYHIDEEIKPLSNELQKVLDNAKNGVIYFSLGSNLKSKDIPKEIKSSLLKMFSRLKQTVLWKFEEDLANIPKNVHLSKWFPQQSILAHPKTILFITHGGRLSTTEAVHFGKPIIGIPIFGDQFTNVARAVQRGFAQRVDLSYTIADDLMLAIQEVTSNPRYVEKAKELSFIYHDRPTKPGKDLVHWVKHVIETKGAQHLRSPALHVPFYQKLYLDLLAVILVILFLFMQFFKHVSCVFNSSKRQIKIII